VTEAVRFFGHARPTPARPVFVSMLREFAKGGDYHVGVVERALRAELRALGLPLGSSTSARSALGLARRVDAARVTGRR
jgi:hypothetical protein